MRICLVSAEQSPYGGIGHALRRQAEVLESRHEVRLIEAAGLEPAADVAGLGFAGEDHRRGAAVLAAIERAYPDRGPDLLEVCDYRATGLVALQARRAGHELLRETRVGVRLSSTAELIALHDVRLEDPVERRVAELEREQFRLADLLLSPGGEVLELYRRYYRDLRLPPTVTVGRPFPVPLAPPQPQPSSPEDPLGILYVGRLQRLKGVLDLVEACLRLPRDDWQLTLIGADTTTAVLGQSVRLTIEAMCGGDPRVRIEDVIPHDALQRRWADHDLLVAPSTFEVCGNVPLEAMRAGVPVLATPVGCLPGMIEHGVDGWLTEGTGAVPVGAALSRLLDRREEVERVRTSGRVFESFLRLTDPEVTLQAYEELLEVAPPAAPVRVAASEEPLVTAVVPYYRSHDYVGEAIGSLLGQTHRNLDVVLVNDGSFEPEDAVLAELEREPRLRLVHQLNGDHAAARNLGLALADGEYLMMFDSDNLLEPEFVARALAMLRTDPELAYVTCWLRFIDEHGEPFADCRGYAPLGNRVLAEADDNWDGDMTALFPRAVLEQVEGPYAPAASLHADWDLYRRLRARGEYGAVIPEILARYRIHPESMLRVQGEELHRRSRSEGRVRRKMLETQWTTEAASER